MKTYVAKCLIGVLASMGMSVAGEEAPSGSIGRQDMIGALQADGPHASLGGHGREFGRLVGTWAVEYADISKDGRVTHRTGELLVGWVLDGRAIQDVWIVDPSGSRTDREVYADIRYFDPKSGSWPATFVDPEHASFANFTGGAVGNDRIVLETKDLGALRTRWSFNDIRQDSFEFRDEASNDDGKTWRLQSFYHMKRHAAAQTSR